RGAAGFGALQQGEAILEHLRRRVAEALVDEARILAGEPLIGRAGGVVREALGQIEGFRNLAIWRAGHAAAHQLGFLLPIARVFGHGLILPTEAAPSKPQLGPPPQWKI